MMKKGVITVLFTLLAISMTAEAKGLIDFGIKAGYTAENVKYRGASHGDYNVSTSNRGGFHVGLVSRINLFTFHIQPELLYSRTSYKLNFASINSSIRSSKSVVMQNVEVPIMFGLRLFWFRFQAGPMLSLLTDTSSGSNPSVEITKPTVSFLLGLGFDIRNINLDVRYNGQFKRPSQRIYNDIPIGTEFKHSYKSKINKWMFSVGYLF